MAKASRVQSQMQQQINDINAKLDLLLQQTAPKTFYISDVNLPLDPAAQGEDVPEGDAAPQGDAEPEGDAAPQGDAEPEGDAAPQGEAELKPNSFEGTKTDEPGDKPARIRK